MLIFATTCKIMKRLKYRTDSLFASSSFVLGFFSIFNLGGNYFPFRISSSGGETDTKAMETDWGVVGEDIRTAIRSFQKNTNGY